MGFTEKLAAEALKQVKNKDIENAIEVAFKIQ